MKKEARPDRKNKKIKKIAVALACAVFFVSSVLAGLQFGVIYTDHAWKHWYAGYEKQDISALLDKETLSSGDYALLYAQTGLTRIGVDGLLQAGDKGRILAIQDFYFKKHTVSCDRFNPFTYLETVEAHAPIALLEDGDIIVSATTHVSGWRLGHAALVVDGKYGRIAEALGPGDVSKINSVTTFTNLADFMILRPKFDRQFRADVAAYAKQNMMGAQYNFSVGILTRKYNAKAFTRTQCAHLVWYAYKKFGVDLDSNGGLVVTPPEIAHSPYVELVQVFGFDPVALWSDASGAS